MMRTTTILRAALTALALVTGSVAARVLHLAPCPVLLVK